MGGLIILIFIGVFISKLVKASGNSNTKKNARQSAQPQKQVRRTTQAERDAYYYNQQRNTKQRLQQKYGTQQKSTPKSDILARAKENVQENDANTIQQELHANACRDYRASSHVASNVNMHRVLSADCDTIGESDILKKVNDLMVTGYSGDMKFERDFLAEGIDMLNRFSL